MDRTGIIHAIDSEVADILGSTPAVLSGKNMMSFIPPGLHEFFYEGWAQVVEGKRKVLICTCEHTEGFLVPLELRFVDRVEDDDGVFFLLRIADRSRSVEIGAELETIRESYLLLAETTTDAILQIDHDLKIVFANTAARRTFGYSKGELLHQSMAKLFPESQYQRYLSRIEKYFVIDEDQREGSGMQNIIEVLAQRKSGEMLPMEISLGNSKGHGERRLLTCILRDVTLRKKADRRVRYLAYHDKLTSLGNRDRFAQTLARVLEDVKAADDHHAALLYLDLDGFKKINDSLGHEVGDTILKACAKRLVNSLREGDQVYQFDLEEIFRLGGDEFTILLPHVRHPDDAAIVANRVIDRITEPFAIEDVPSVENVRLGVSIGISIIPKDGDDATTLLRNADAAMYRAKERGNRFVFFTEDMNTMAVERLMLEQGVRRALARNEFELYYQPIVNSDGTLIYFEALVRWNRPDRGVVNPGVFLDMIDELGLVIPFGTWVISTACRDIKRLREWSKSEVSVAVNISTAHLDEPDIAEIVRKILERSKIGADALTIELTEDTVMANPERAKRKLLAIRRLNPGISFAIDDFGTGYSSLAYLTSFPVDKLKIDRSFVMQMHSGDNEKVIKTIINLARALNLQIIAEGVETEDQLAALKESRCDLFQGYHFLKPTPMSRLESLLKSFASNPSLFASSGERSAEALPLEP